MGGVGAGRSQALADRRSSVSQLPRGCRLAETKSRGESTSRRRPVRTTTFASGRRGRCLAKLPGPKEKLKSPAAPIAEVPPSEEGAMTGCPSRRGADSAAKSAASSNGRSQCSTSHVLELCPAHITPRRAAALSPSPGSATIGIPRRRAHSATLSSPATTKGRNPVVSAVSTVLAANRIPSSLRALGSRISASRPLPSWNDFTGRMAIGGTPRSVDRNRPGDRSVVGLWQVN